MQPRDVIVQVPFELDAFEVTVHRWSACVRAQACAALPSQTELGRPVRRITFEQAQRFCRWAGGEVPTEDAWILAAAGPSARRYPWGDTGAVCRRADWGRLRGPCAKDASGPEWAGLFAQDTTADGVGGLAGGVSEWVTTSNGAAIRGGSYKSQLATELRTWRRDERSSEGAYEDVGVRCMYAR